MKSAPACSSAMRIGCPRPRMFQYAVISLPFGGHRTGIEPDATTITSVGISSVCGLLTFCWTRWTGTCMLFCSLQHSKLHCVCIFGWPPADVFGIFGVAFGVSPGRPPPATPAFLPARQGARPPTTHRPRWLKSPDRLHSHSFYSVFSLVRYFWEANSGKDEDATETRSEEPAAMSTWLAVGLPVAHQISSLRYV